MSGVFRPRNVAIGVGVAGGLMLFARTPTGKSIDPIRSNPPNTPGVANINNRFSKGGGSETGTPAVATARNSAEDQGTTHYYENNVATGKSGTEARGKSNKKDESGGTPGKEQEHKGSPDANANAVDRKGQTGREGSHGNLRDVSISQAG